jgi:cytochrome c-type biogenesis protein CcmH/NrfG
MIWALGLGLALVVSFYLAAPFLARNEVASDTAEIEAYKAELRALEQSEEPETAKKAIIQARLLKAAKAELPITKAQSVIFPSIIGIALIGGSAGVYGLIGSPNFTPESRQAPPPMVAEAGTPNFADLLPRFEARLAENPDDATGWYLYGRTLMLAGDSEAGLRAYEKALDLADTPDIRKEYEAAKQFAEQVQSGPSAEDIAAMQNLSEEDRQAAIENMVESLSARLEDNPNNVEGWIRLLRARKVLGQTDAAATDMKRLRTVFPVQANEIIEQAGWTE